MHKAKEITHQKLRTMITDLGYKVFVTHHRKLFVNAAEIGCAKKIIVGNAIPLKEIRKRKLQCNIWPRGGSVSVEVVDSKDNNVLKINYPCNDSDNFNRKRGLVGALGRTYSALKKMNDNKNI